MDAGLKKQLDEFCHAVGMNTNTAINMFARVVTREQRLPFEVTTNVDPFYSDSNMAYLKEAIAALNAGKGVEHELIELGNEESLV
jgi:DNA-damage-inducible protein J